METTEQFLKIKAVVSYILQQIPEGLDYIHLFKMMYLAQQEHLVIYGTPIFDDSFVARKHGPVPTFTYKVLKGKEGKANLDSLDLLDFANSISLCYDNGHPTVKLAEGSVYDKDELSNSNVKILDRWIQRCRDISAFYLSDLSHDKAWQKTKRQADRTGEDTKISLYDMAMAGGASKDMIDIIKERQINRNALS